MADKQIIPIVFASNENYAPYMSVAQVSGQGISGLCAAQRFEERNSRIAAENDA